MKTFEEVSSLIKEGRLLHIAGNDDLLRKLPKGDWVGGSTDYFMSAEGGIISDTLLFVTEFPRDEFRISNYCKENINQVAVDAYDSGYSILIMPFGSEISMEYALNATEYEGMYIKNIVGWVSGVRIELIEQPEHPPIVVNGMTGEVFTDKVVALHLHVPESKTVSINIINIFNANQNSPAIEFDHFGTQVTTCHVDGKEVKFVDYIKENNFDTRLPIISDCFGVGLNIDIVAINDDGMVQLGAPVFPNVKYYPAEKVDDYEETFNNAIKKLKNIEAVFACNCLSNFLHGGLEGKKIKSLFGPVVFGEIAYQRLSQTLVYVTLE